jgi:hypothetical protein
MPGTSVRNDRSGDPVTTKETSEIKKYDLTDKGVVAACHAKGAKLRITAVPTTGSFRQFIDDVTHRRGRDYLRAEVTAL